ncbi:CDP-glycerol glycerophosphotransferase family protein [Oceanobacillus neutriphilus]|uniref:CDP-glycerol glycerophosphotransferase family protein n=1 Tax=Oceanobacillus neutriphilus TaxID=531815 RepID=UPI001E3A3638|nr:CDP-glycerol glycerophosphotransferase family protein [Oceanobacillus neutriphilus]
MVQSRAVAEKSIEIDVSLKNFISYAGISAVLTNGMETIDLPYQRVKKKLTIAILISHLSDDVNNYIVLSNAKQKFWLKLDEHIKEKVLYHVVGNKLFRLSVNKKVLVKNLLPEFSFSNELKIIKNLYTSYSELTAVLENMDLNIDSHEKMFALKHGEMKPLEIAMNKETSTFEVLDFNQLSQGDWRLIIAIGDTAYFLESKTQEEISLLTSNHQGVLKYINKNFYLSLDNYYLEIEAMKLKVNEDTIQLEVATDIQPDKFQYTFLIQDTKLNKEFVRPVERTNNGFKTEILLENILEGSTIKRFFLLKEDSEGKHFKYQFFIETAKIFKRRSFKVIYNSQEYVLRVYRRKDKSMGSIIVRKPKLRRLMKSVKDFRLSGFIGNLHVFKDCTFYLAVEDRNTLDIVEYPLTEENFEVSIAAEDLIKVKGKEKSILDFFITVKDAEGNTIRKDKIKYELADYRKDNYYESIKEKDEYGNKHYFLVTTTPFDNMKIETFTIPKGVNMLSNTAGKDPNVWLIGERYNTAQDNGIALFRWLRKNTTIDAYYVIEEDAEDYRVLKDMEYVLCFGSKEHFEIASRAKVLLGTHDLENLLPYKPAQGFFNYEDTIKVFLQHGVLGRKPVEYDKKNYELPFDLFIVSSEPEKYDVVMNKMGYNEEEVAVTGLARFDNLPKENHSKDILLMPTWRDWIHTDEQFLKSQYYNYYNNLINNERLQGILEEYNVNLNFYPHYRAQNFFAQDINEENSRIHFIRLGSKTVQQLLIDHALLITDFSSVSFDFTLMNKPVIYYHFDVNRFFKRGILRPVEETFLGKIAQNETDLVDMIEESIENNFKSFDIELDNIIKYQDRHNCQRIYQTVLSKLNKENEKNEG